MRLLHLTATSRRSALDPSNHGRHRARIAAGDSKQFQLLVYCCMEIDIALRQFVRLTDGRTKRTLAISSCTEVNPNSHFNAAIVTTL